MAVRAVVVLADTQPQAARDDPGESFTHIIGGDTNPMVGRMGEMDFLVLWWRLRSAAQHDNRRNAQLGVRGLPTG